MPQSSDELRAEMERRFGDPVSEEGPYKFLIAAGYRLEDDHSLTPKLGIEHSGQVTDEEWDCIVFLAEEWDYDLLNDNFLIEQTST